MNAGAWGTYPDARDDGYGAGLGGLGALPDQLVYVADLGPVGSGATYYPRDTMRDAEALAFLGLLSEAELSEHVGTLGSAAKDMGAGQGAWNPEFQRAVRVFQGRTGGRLTVDGWIGPKTRTVMIEAVTQENARRIAGRLPAAPAAPPIPGLPAPSVPRPGVLDPTPVAPKPGQIAPVAAKEEDDTLLYVGLGVGVLALLGIGYYALS